MKISLYIFLLLSIGLTGQNTFQKTFGGNQQDFAKSVQQTTDNGYIILGQSGGYITGDIYLIKTDINGNMLWSKAYGGPNNEIGNHIEKCIDNGYIITGYTTSFGAGGFDLFLIKTDSLENSIWSKTYGGIGNDQGSCVRQTSDGGFIVFGDTPSFGAGMADFWLIKTDSNGDSLWTKTYGGMYDETSAWLEQTSDNGYIISGSTKSFGSGYKDICLIKTNSIGDVLWTKVYGGVDDEGWSYVKQTSDNGYVITGETISYGVGNGDIFLLKTDVSGNINWIKTYGSNYIDDSRSVKQTNDGGYIIGGYNSANGYDGYLIKTNAVGDTIWTRVYGNSNSNSFQSGINTSDNGYIFTGVTYNTITGNNDVYLMKTDSLGLSGCNNISYTTSVNSASMITMSPTMSISSGAIISNFNPNINSYGTQNTICQTITNINTQENIATKTIITPNPFSNSATLKLPKQLNQKSKLIIYNTNGAIVYLQDDILNEELIIEGITLVNGLYFFQLIADNKAFASGKFIIQH